MKNATYLIPVTRNGNKKLVLEYKVVTTKKDNRTKFCKLHKKHEINSFDLIFNTKTYSLMKFIDTEMRLIAPNGKIAYEFQKELTSRFSYEV